MSIQHVHTYAKPPRTDQYERWRSKGNASYTNSRTTIAAIIAQSNAVVISTPLITSFLGKGLSVPWFIRGNVSRSSENTILEV